MQINLVNREIDYLVEGKQGWKDGNLIQAIEERGVDVKLPWPVSVEFQVIPGWFLVTMMKAGFSPLSCEPYVEDEDAEALALLKAVSLEEVEISPNARIVLEEAGYRTLADVFGTDEESLGEIQGVGEKTVDALSDAIQEALNSGMEEEEEVVAEPLAIDDEDEWKETVREEITKSVEAEGDTKGDAGGENT